MPIICVYSSLLDTRENTLMMSLSLRFIAFNKNKTIDYSSYPKSEDKIQALALDEDGIVSPFACSPRTIQR